MWASGPLAGEHRWTYSNLLLEGVGAWPLLSRGGACHEPLSMGLAGNAAAQTERMACCIVHLHSSGRELKLGFKLFNYYPLLIPSHLSSTYRPTLPIGMSADGHHRHTHNTACSCQEHAHTWVCPALTYSIHQCPGVKAGLYLGYGEKGPTSGLKPPGMKQALGPNMEYPESHKLSSQNTQPTTDLMKSQTYKHIDKQTMSCRQLLSRQCLQCHQDLH